MTPEEKLTLAMARDILAALPAEERLEAWKALMEDYCTHCGCEHPEHGDYCQCWNDE